MSHLQRTGRGIQLKSYLKQPTDTDSGDVPASFLTESATFQFAHLATPSPVVVPDEAIEAQAASAQSGPGGPGSVVAVTSGGLTINLVLDAAAMAAPASFRSGIQMAAAILSAAISKSPSISTSCCNQRDLRRESNRSRGLHFASDPISSRRAIATGGAPHALGDPADRDEDPAERCSSLGFAVLRLGIGRSSRQKPPNGQRDYGIETTAAAEPCWRISNIFRLLISRLPPKPGLIVSQLIATMIYWPLARLAANCRASRAFSAAIPLESYRNRDFAL